MTLVRLTYVSKLAPNTDPSELKKIHETAKKFNQENDITGILVFGDDYFLQCLEGGRQVVNRLYSKIQNDRRHSDALILEYGELSERSFSGWSMKLVLLSADKKELVRRYSTAGKFNPYEMSGASAFAFMRAMGAD